MDFKEWLNNPIFIRGIPPWEKNTPVMLPPGEISVSLHKPGLTPLRPYGYVLKVHPGGIIAAFDRDVCSDKNGNNKCISQKTSHKQYRNYGECELDQLLANTRPGFHNEIWIDSDKADIIGAYVTGISPGWKQFKNDVMKRGLKVQSI